MIQLHPHALYSHHNIVDGLTHRLRSGLPHALLFQGLKGIGKATCAYHLAHAVLTQSSSVLTRINHDDALYNRLRTHGHSDVLVIKNTEDEAGKFSKEITVSHARHILSFLSKTALAGGWRIIIIDSIDEMNRQALNAILKGLEEPPPQCLFILINHQPGRLLPTIASRCQRFIFAPLKETALQQVLTINNPGSVLTSSALSLLHTFAEGSVGRAQQFLHYDGESVFKELQNVIIDLQQDTWSSCLNFIKEAIAETKNNNYDQFTFISDMISLYYKNLIDHLVFKRPQSIKPMLVVKRTIKQWIDIWSYSQKLFRDTLILSLDPLQTFVNAFALFTPSAQIPHQHD